MFCEMLVRVVKQIQHFTQQRKTKFVFDRDQTTSNIAEQILCDQTRRPKKPKISSNICFIMLGEMFDLFNRRLTK